MKHVFVVLDGFSEIENLSLTHFAVYTPRQMAGGYRGRTWVFSDGDLRVTVLVPECFTFYVDVNDARKWANDYRERYHED